MQASFSPVKTASVRTTVIEAIRSAIFSGHLRPGDSLLEIQLARELQVSQTSIREALLKLEQLGLVRRVPHRGTFVTKLSPEEVRERVEIRMQLEETAALQAAPKMTPEHAAELHARVEEISAAILQNAYFESARADLDFHRHVWRISGNKTLFSVLDQVSAPMLAFISIMRSNRLDDLKRVIHSHQAIVTVLESGDPATIREVIRGHFAESYEQFIQPAPPANS